jgi:predicted nuclease of predicted toxin-antitoxin system
LRLLLDQGLPRTTVERLRERGVEAVHTADVNLAAAPDRAILAFAREQIAPSSRSTPTSTLCS